MPLVTDIFNAERAAAGISVNKDLCEHFAHTRQELYQIIKMTGASSIFEMGCNMRASGVPVVSTPATPSWIDCRGHADSLGTPHSMRLQAAKRAGCDRVLLAMQ